MVILLFCSTFPSSLPPSVHHLLLLSPPLPHFSQIDLMDHPLYTISYVADIENVLVVMINRMPPPPPPPPQGGRGGDGDVQKVEEKQVEGGEVEGEVRENKEGGGRVEEENREGEQNEGGHVEGKEAEVQGEGDGEGQAGEGEGEEEEGEGEGERKGERDGDGETQTGPIPRMTCHVLETSNVRITSV